MAMKYPMQVPIAHKLRQPVFYRPGDFIASFAQLRLDKLEAQGFIDVFFRRGSNQFPAAVETVRPYLQTFVTGTLCELFDMVCGAGCVQEARAKMFLVGHSDFKTAGLLIR